MQDYKSALLFVLSECDLFLIIFYVRGKNAITKLCHIPETILTCCTIDGTSGTAVAIGVTSWLNLK